MLVILINAEQDGQRLDKALASISGMSRNHILACLNSAHILDFKNRIIKKASLIVRLGQEFKIILPTINTIPSTHTNNNNILNVVYEDEYILIADKPAGQASHPSPGHATDTLLDNAISYLNNTHAHISTFNGSPVLINRLDLDTSGLILLAKDDYTHNHIKQQFSDRSITKIYKATVHNYELLPNTFYIESFIGPHHMNNALMESYEQKIYNIIPIRYADLQHSLKSKISQNHLEIINKNQRETYESDYTTYNHIMHLYNATRFKYGFLECMKYNNDLLCLPHTGRKHQIRVQLATQRTPIHGDILYSQATTSSLQLRSILVNFFHPKKSKFLTVFNP